MARKIFWSWQSDTPERETRHVIREALILAIDRIACDLEEDERPDIDQDTKDVPGSPEIVATILRKIERASVFVGDVTPMTVHGGKHLPNPNVLIELGYAKHAIGPDFVILVWNTAFTMPRPEDLPFDLRHRRGPISFNLPAGADKSERGTVRKALAMELELRLRACLDAVPPPPAPALAWYPPEEGWHGVWQGIGNGLDANVDRLQIKLTFDGAPRGYARVIPHRFTPVADAIDILENRQSLPPLGRANSVDWGPCPGGFVSFSAIAAADTGQRRTASRWFRATGEIWGFDADFFSAAPSRIFATTYARDRWYHWIERVLALSTTLGATGPFSIILGLEGLIGTRWPSSGALALEPACEHGFSLERFDEDGVNEAIQAIMIKAAAAYGMG